jgi:GNAT superfamily N-acetyltransferase
MFNHILTDLSTPSLARVIKDNLYDYFRFLGRSATSEIEEGPGWLRWRTPVYHPWFNGVLCSRPPAAGDTAFVENNLTFFQSHSTPAITWWLSPDQRPTEWAPYLQAHGFHFDDSTPGMALVLDVLPAELTLPPGLEIVHVKDAATLKTWVDVFAEGYPIPIEVKDPLLTLLINLGLDLPVRNYLGYLDGVPVVTSNMYLGAGVAGVMFVATLPPARGKGLGAAMTLAPLYEARQLGFLAGILQSSQMGYPVYQRLGFQHLCAMEHFYWSVYDEPMTD